MNAVWKVITEMYMVLAGLPFIPFVVVYLLGRLRGMERKKAIRLAMDVTTAFLVGIVAALLSQLSGSGFGFYMILLLMLVGAGLIGNAQNRVRGKINAPLIVKAVWRLSFFALAVLYLFLMPIHLLLPSSN